MKALRVRRPWASQILLEGKAVENRSWPTSWRGPLAIHAAARLDEGASGPWPGWLPLGAVIGVVELVDCVRDHLSPSALPGQWHWVLANPRPFRTPIPARGQPGLWEWEPPAWVHDRRLGRRSTEEVAQGRVTGVVGVVGAHRGAGQAVLEWQEWEAER